MRLLSLAFIAVLFTISSCSRRDCGCTPPPLTETTWKITSRYGGVSGGDIPLTAAEKEHIITIRSDASFTCKNKSTGQEYSGGMIYTFDFPSIYGAKPRITLSTTIPILKDDYLILLERDNSKIIFGDNVADGYFTRLEPAL